MAEEHGVKHIIMSQLIDVKPGDPESEVLDLLDAVCGRERRARRERKVRGEERKRAWEEEVRGETEEAGMGGRWKRKMSGSGQDESCRARGER
jgi:hypothetical protein